MTTLRETLAMAIAQERDLGPGDRSWNRQNEDYVAAILRVLATWEPSEEMLRAIEWRYTTTGTMSYAESQLVKRRAVTKAVLRAMAEEGS